MGTGRKPRYPGLSALRRRKKCRDYVDYDYVAKLSPEEKGFLNQFTEEFYNGNGYKYAKPLLEEKEMAHKNYIARSDLMNEWQRVDSHEGGQGRPEASEDAIVEAIDAYGCPALERAPSTPALRKTSSSPGLGVFTHCPDRERPTPFRGGPPKVSSIPFARLESGVTKKRVKNTRLAAAIAPKPVVAGPEQVRQIFKNISALMKIGLFPGANAVHVAEAIRVLDDTVSQGSNMVAPAETQGTEAAANG